MTNEAIAGMDEMCARGPELLTDQQRVDAITTSFTIGRLEDLLADLRANRKAVRTTLWIGDRIVIDLTKGTAA